ncbi:MAG: hypothetical protein ABL997_13980, partial [Planctomycetota bacterium]
MRSIPRTLTPSSRRSLLPLVALAVVAACSAPPAARELQPAAAAVQRADVTQDPGPAPAAPSTGVRFVLDPYLWASSVDGDVRAGPGSGVNVSAGFDDILENLDVGFMLAGEVEFDDRFSVLADVTYMDLGADGETPLLGAPVSASNELLHAQVSAVWQVQKTDLATLDLTAGLRIVDVEAALDTGIVSARRSETFFDPTTGVRVTVPLGEGFHFRALGDIGGFGVGTDLSYQVLATLGVELSESCLLGVGWRHLGIDFDA